MALAACAPAISPGAQGAGLTIVSTNPCSDAILAEVADPAQLLAISSYSQDPASSSMDLAKARAMRATSGAVEEIMALDPDVVIGSSFTPPATRAALDRLGYRFEGIGLAGTITESKDQIRQLAALTGHPERGEALIAQIDQALAQAAPPPGPPIAAVVWQSGGIVPGEGTLITDLLGKAGFVNFAAQQGLQQADMLPLETMLANPPRVIFTAGSMQADEDRLLRHPALAGLTGTHRARLHPILLWCGGPTIPRTLARLAEVRREVEAGGGQGASTGSARAELGYSPIPQSPLRLSLSKPPRFGGSSR